MRGIATNTTTYKCEGCGVRRDASTLYAGDRDLAEDFTVCSPACALVAQAQWERQRYDNRILALVGN